MTMQARQKRAEYMAMARYVRISPYPTEEYPQGYKVELVIGVQGFRLSDGVTNCHENRQTAKWVRRQLCFALLNLRKQFMEAK